MQATASTPTPALSSKRTAPHLTVARCSGDCAQGDKPCTCPTGNARQLRGTTTAQAAQPWRGPAEASTDLGFEQERGLRARRRWQPIKALHAWYLHRALRSLLARHRHIDGQLTGTANVVIDMARRHQVCPWWPDMRRDLQQQRATLERQLAEVSAELAALERRA